MQSDNDNHLMAIVLLVWRNAVLANRLVRTGLTIVCDIFRKSVVDLQMKREQICK